MGDASGWKRGEKGYACDSGKGTHRQWDSSKAPKVDFDRAKLYGPVSSGGADGGLAPRNKDKGFKGIHSVFADKIS